MGLSRDMLEAELFEIDQLRGCVRGLLLHKKITGFEFNTHMGRLDERERKLRNRFGAQVGNFVSMKQEERGESRKNFPKAHRTYQGGKVEKYWATHTGDNFAKPTEKH